MANKAELKRYTKKIIMRIALSPFRLFPVKKNRIVLYNNLGYKYSDNPKCVAEYLSKEYPGKFEIIFPMTDMMAC